MEIELSAKIDFIKAVLAKNGQAVVMIGLMGSGKSKLGKALAEAFGIHFIDSDDVIVKNHGEISSIFALHDGEKRFRKIERNVIETIISGDPRVMSTGGGAFIDDQTCDLINDKAISVWLNISPEDTMGRLNEAAIAKRPLLANAEDGPLAKLTELYAARSDKYGKAHVRVDVSDEGTSSMEESVAQNRDRVINALYTYLQPE